MRWLYRSFVVIILVLAGGLSRTYTKWTVVDSLVYAFLMLVCLFRNIYYNIQVSLTLNVGM